MSTMDREAGTQVPTTSTGLLVLGMHRSGTSALAGVLAMCGGDPGARVSGAGLGNESGHWEDETAVEVHERLLAAFGARWDDPFPLLDGWTHTAGAQRAAADVQAYVSGNRSRHALWLVKDPRLSLFPGLWRDSIQAAGQRGAAILMLRHPLEVARSLQARDGIGTERGLLLWYDYTMSALEACTAMPMTLVSYAGLLSDWRATVARIRALPGTHALAPDHAAVAVEAFLQPGRRHQHTRPTHTLAGDVGDAWEALVEGMAADTPPAQLFATLQPQWRAMRERWQPLAEEWRVERRKLWERAGRAEALVAVDASSVPAHLQAFAQSLHEHQAAMMATLSEDLRRMQDALAEAQASASLVEGQRRQAEAGRLDAIESAQRLRDELQVVQASAATSAALVTSLRAEAEVVQRAARETITETLRLHQAAITEALSGDLRRMQEVVAEMQAAAALAERAREQAQAEAQRLGSDLAVARRQVAVAESNVVSAGQERDLLARDLTDLRRELAAAESNVVSAGQERALLARDLTNLRRELAAAESNIDSAQREREHLQAMLDQAHARAWDLGAQLERIVASRSWRLTRPVRALMRLLRGEWQASDSARLRQSLRGMVPGAPSISAGTAQPRMTGETAPVALLPAVPPPREGLPDIFVWAVIDWRFRVQRPQHLARALASRGHRVFYLSNEFVDAPAPGFRVDSLDPALPLHQVHLHVPGAPAIYHAAPGRAELESLRASLAALLGWTCTRDSIGIAHHPYWSPLLRSLPATRVVYDCMDHHGGFENNAGSVLDAEARLVTDADLVIVTSEWLEREIAPRARATATIRNAGEFTHFSKRPRKVFADPAGRPIIGYFGAIAEWFDAELVRTVALARPDALVVLVGSDTAGVGESLAEVGNVRMIGEVPYADLPYWVHGFDVCLLPFKVVPLTLATNPVKVYEYLAAGKPVVSVDLPEMAQFGDCVRVAKDMGTFAVAVSDALDARDNASAIERRQAFASSQTWGHRAAALDDVLAALPEPRVSVIVLTYNNLAFTQACLFSVEAYSAYANLEVIVVDNASSDGSREWLQAWAAEPSAAGHARRLVLNDDNLGFAAGNNVGLREATGELLILLNNDTYVTPGWVRGLANHLRDEPALGLVGPVTNNIGNEAKVDLHYADMAEMIAVAGEHTRAHPGMRLTLSTAAFFCVAMRREVYERVGGLDERFGVGFFEDDDYCRRVEQAGYGIACAEDVFVHHHLSASFDALQTGQKQALFDRNKALYEAKWGEWRPHAYRGQPEHPAA